jgi:hypothetical protein
MNSTPQVETAEISDSDLDNVSGGLVGEVLSTAVATADSVSPVSVSGTLATGAGLVSSVTGVDTGIVTGAISGL